MYRRQTASRAESFELRRRVLVLQKLIRRDHRDAIPRADLVAQRAADAAGEVDRADLETLLVPRAGDQVDAIDRADRHARSQPVHMSSSSNASTLGSFFFAIGMLDSIGRSRQLATAGRLPY
jgi:hypothetical protein